MTTAESKPTGDFIRHMVAEDVSAGRWAGRVITRFPPEPNGFLHIGHAKSICLNFGLAEENAGTAPGGARCHLRFDDTNPTKEEQVYIDSIKSDVRWLGFDWGEHEYHASDYFDQLYAFAQALIKAGKAYVDDQSAEEVRERRGTLTTPGEQSPYRDRSPKENLDLLERMRNGEFPDGSKVLRAKIDMASPNLNMRDPVMYRILHAEHPRTGNKWCIYPTYDFAHGQSDWIEGVTHSLCTLEFEDHRPLYDWFLDSLIEAGVRPEPPHGQPPVDRPRQTEFARLNLTYTAMSKRKLLELVREGYVAGWDDPRMPTISALRRRGYTPESIRDFCEGIGVAKRDQTIQVERLEHHVRQHLNKTAPRVMAALDPLKIVIENYPEGEVEWMDAINNPEDESAGTRKIPFTRELYIERGDFMEDPPKKFFRLAPGREVRLRYGYWVTCTDVVRDENGEITELRCTYDPQTRGGESPPDGRKVKGTLHWVSADHAIDAEVRLYERLFTKEDPDDVDHEEQTWRDNINPESRRVITAKAEPSVAEAAVETRFQFERQGYFCVDPDSEPGRPVLNRTVGLKDTWAKMQKQGKV
jgi:glutaminyl-tRNA synthetase